MRTSNCLLKGLQCARVGCQQVAAVVAFFRTLVLFLYLVQVPLSLPVRKESHLPSEVRHVEPVGLAAPRPVLFFEFLLLLVVALGVLSRARLRVEATQVLLHLRRHGPAFPVHALDEART